MQTQRREPCVEWDTFCCCFFLFVYFWLSCSPVKLVTHGGDCYTTWKMNVKRLYGVRTLRDAAKRCLRRRGTSIWNEMDSDFYGKAKTRIRFLNVKYVHPSFESRTQARNVQLKWDKWDNCGTFWWMWAGLSSNKGPMTTEHTQNPLIIRTTHV